MTISVWHILAGAVLALLAHYLPFKNALAAIVAAGLITGLFVASPNLNPYLVSAGVGTIIGIVTSFRWN